MLVEKLLSVARKRLITTPADSLLAEAARLLSETHTALLVVCNSRGGMVGVITKTDIVRRIGRHEGDSSTVNAATLMTQDVVYCHPNDPVHEVLSIMKERNVVHVPVIDQDSKPLGVLNARDALQVLLGEAEYDIRFLRDYVMNVGYH